MPKSNTTISAPNWDNARTYLDAARQAGRRYIVATICLGWELQIIKQQLGFARGYHQGSGGTFEAKDLTWEQWVNTELDIPRRTADHFIQVFHGFSEKLTKRLLTTISGPTHIATAEELLHTLASPPDSLTQKERDKIEKAISICSDGATQGELLAELKLAKSNRMPAPNQNRHGDPDDDEEDLDKPASPEQLSFAFFSGLNELGMIRADRDFERRLSCLPLVTDTPDKPCLVRMRDDLASMLHEVESTIKLKQSAAS